MPARLARNMRLARAAALAAAALVVNAASGQEAVCGDPFHNHFGPFDYRTATVQQRTIVETYHFTPDVAALRRGSTGERIGGDIAYTLHVFPNHPRALMAMAELARRQKNPRPRGAEYDISCWFWRALTFRPDDGQVRLVIGIELLKDGKVKDAIEQLEAADKMMPNDPNVQYNLGLAYFDAGDRQRSLEHAKMAYDLGFPLPGLRRKLEQANAWR